MNKSSNIFCIKQFAFIPPPYGGVSTYVKRLILRLNQLGITTGGYYLSDCTDSIIQDSNLFHKWKWMPTHLFLFRIIQYAFETRKYKIVHSHFSLEGMLYLWFLRTFCNKKIIITVHNAMVNDYLAKTNFLNRFFLKKMSQFQDVTWIAVSPQVKSSLLDLNLEFASDIHVIPAYIPPIKKQNSELPISLQRYIDSYSKVMVFYGHSLMQYSGNDVYGFDIVLRLYASLSADERCNIGLVYCIATCSEGEFASILAKAKSMGVDKSIFWQVGALDDMTSLWEQADVYVRPTYTDGDSVAVREALDMGVQVVASNVCQRPEKVITYKYGNDCMLLESLRYAISKGREKQSCDETYLNQMVEIYKNILAR